MKSIKIVIPVLVGILFFFLNCKKVTAPISPKMRKLTADEIKVVESSQDFGTKLFKQIVQIEQDKNIFISPLSVSMALGMALNGAAGNTFQAMQSTLQFQNMTSEQINQAYRSLLQLLRNLDPKVIFEIANSIWYRQDLQFEKNFIDLNKKYFDATINPLDFGNPNAINTINNWVKEKTRNKIQKIIGRINPENIMFLINAIYFKGTWKFQFEKELTTEEPFFKTDGSQITCMMMSQRGTFRYLSQPDFEAVDLPYGKGDFYMTIILPHPNTNIDSLIFMISPDLLQQWVKNFSELDGLVEIPRFKLTYKIDLIPVLTELGMGIAFDRYAADFSNLYKGPQNVFISSALHKTFVEVDEEGTEAAAVTSIGFSATSVGGGGFYFRADRPFFFIIREKSSNTILFAGKIVEPQEQ